MFPMMSTFVDIEQPIILDVLMALVATLVSVKKEDVFNEVNGCCEGIFSFPTLISLVTISVCVILLYEGQSHNHMGV